MIKLKNIVKRFPVYDSGASGMTHNKQIRGGFFYALDDVSLTIEDGGCTIIAGANGCGKSLLMLIIAGLEEATSGTIERSERIGLVFQEPDAQILGETPREDIAFGPRNMKLPKMETRARVDSALAQTGLEQRADFPARSLSGGEKRRLAAAGILAMDPQAVIFDEPYANMDFPGVKQINSLFNRLISGKKTLIILTHELEKCMALCSHFIILSGGRIVFNGSPQEALKQDLESWGIHHPLGKTSSLLEDLVW